MEDILAITFIFGGGAIFLVSISPIGRAIADRIRGGSKHLDAGEAGDLREGQAVLFDEVERLRNELSDVREQLDFTERIIAQQRSVDALPKGTNEGA